MIGRMAKEYGMLPSEVEQRACTYDIMVMDVLATYDRYQESRASGKVDPSVYQLSDDEMKAMLTRARG